MIGTSIALVIWTAGLSYVAGRAHKRDLEEVEAKSRGDSTGSSKEEGVV